LKQRSDTGKWEVRWRENGRNRSKSFTRKGDAEKFELRVRRARESGRPLDVDRGSEVLAEFVETYWRQHVMPELSANTRDAYARIWANHLWPALGGYRLRDVTPVVVDELKASLIAAGAGLPTVRKALALVSGMFTCAVRWGYVDRNPVREIRLPMAERTRFVRPLTPARVEALRMRLLSEGNVRDAMLVAVLAYAGLRPQEARALRWGDLGARTLRIERAASRRDLKATKTGKLRVVVLLAPLAEDLRLWRAAQGMQPADGFVFPRADGGFWTDTDYRNWRNRVYEPAALAVGEAGPPYDLRHSFASLLIREGQSSVDVARQLGNSPEVLLRTYTHVFMEVAPQARFSATEAIEVARAEFGVRETYAELGLGVEDDISEPASEQEADAGTRTPDPIITSEESLVPRSLIARDCERQAADGLRRWSNHAQISSISPAARVTASRGFAPAHSAMYGTA